MYSDEESASFSSSTSSSPLASHVYIHRYINNRFIFHPDTPPHIRYIANICQKLDYGIDDTNHWSDVSAERTLSDLPTDVTDVLWQDILRYLRGELASPAALHATDAFIAILTQFRNTVALEDVVSIPQPRPATPVATFKRKRGESVFDFNIRRHFNSHILREPTPTNLFSHLPFWQSDVPDPATRIDISPTYRVIDNILDIPFYLRRHLTRSLDREHQYSRVTIPVDEFNFIALTSQALAQYFQYSFDEARDHALAVIEQRLNGPSFLGDNGTEETEADIQNEHNGRLLAELAATQRRARAHDRRYVSFEATARDAYVRNTPPPLYNWHTSDEDSD